jgi:hypothetical protein
MQFKRKGDFEDWFRSKTKTAIFHRVWITMTAKILPIAMLVVVLGLFTVLLVTFGQSEEFGVLATAAYPVEDDAGDGMSGIGGAPDERFDESHLVEGVQLQVWENRLFVSSDEPMEVYVAVYEDNHPLQNREPVLLLTLSDEDSQTYYFPPTNEEGQTALILPPVTASNGTLVSYEVCLRSLGGAAHCIGENYLIWNTP